MIVISPRIIEAQKPMSTFLPNSRSPKRYAMDAFTVLLDITAIRIVVAATKSGIEPSFAHSDIVKFTASTSANPETRPIP